MSDILQDELRQLFSKAKLPSSPALAAHILELSEDPESTVDQFADVIQMDPALSVRLLSMTNSAALAQRQKVTTIKAAVSRLGINRVRTVSLGFQLVGHLNRLGGCQFDMKKFWQHSLLRACLGREIAIASFPSCADEAFLIGLLQDCGKLLLVQILGKSYAELCQTDNLSPTAFFEAEKRDHRFNHAEVTTALAREWKLPDFIIANVELHHTEPLLVPSPTDEDRLRYITYLIGSVTLTTNESIGSAEPVLDQFVKSHLSMDEKALQHALAAAGEAYAEMAEMLKGMVPEDLDVTDLLSQANAHLTMCIESERDQSSKEQAILRGSLGEYRELAARDPLTGILNRGALNDAVEDFVQQARLTGQTVTVLFLDLDNFKQLNDRLGHQVGDEVLRGVAETLQGCVLNAGITGRYGGEEFLLAVVSLSEDNAKKLVENVLARVRGTQFPELGFPGPVTCSLGAVWGIPNADMSADSLVQAADELMYQAKRSGKDCCCFRIMGDVHNIDLLESDRDTIDACAAAVNEGTIQTPDKTVPPEEYQRIAKQLDGHTPQRILNIRKNERKDLLTPCRLTVLVGGTLRFKSREGYMRNISTGGVGVLTTQSMHRGQPVEIAMLLSPAKSRLYIAGVVAFCRHIEGDIHEIGVQLFTHSKKPILSDDPVSAIRNLDWVAQALQSMQRDALATA